MSRFVYVGSRAEHLASGLLVASCEPARSPTRAPKRRALTAETRRRDTAQVAGVTALREDLQAAV